MRRPLLPVLLGVVAVAGCGGSGGLSDKDYRTKADAICASVKSQRDRLPPASNIEELRAVARSTIAINTEALRRFKELKPPDDLKAPNSVIVTRLSETLRLQQQALTTDPKSQAMESINVRAGQSRAALLKSAQQAKLPACQAL
jgi:hypothetical protein